jgi:hypothetical protein
MAIVDWGHLCDYAFFDENKKVCLIGLFTHIRAAHVPTQHPQCAFVFSLSGTPNETVKIKFEVIRPDGKDPLINIENPSLSLTPTGTVTNNFVLENILLPDFGPYEISIFLNNELAHTTTLHVSRDTR